MNFETGKFDKVIVLTAFNRPGYLRLALESLRRNNCWRWHLLCTVEPNDHQVYDLCNAVDFVDHTVIRNEVHLGVRNNPYRALTLAFDVMGAEYVLYFEDDVVLAPDGLDLARWFMESGSDKLLLRLFNDSVALRPVEDILVTDTMSTLGLVIRRQGWQTILKPNWYNDHHKFAPQQGWDWSVGAFLNEKNISLLMPAMSRSLHIGREDGTWCRPDQHDAMFGKVVVSDAMRPVKYRIVP